LEFQRLRQVLNLNFVEDNLKNKERYEFTINVIFSFRFTLIVLILISVTGFKTLNLLIKVVKNLKKSDWIQGFLLKSQRFLMLMKTGQPADIYTQNIKSKCLYLFLKNIVYKGKIKGTPEGLSKYYQTDLDVLDTLIGRSQKPKFANNAFVSQLDELPADSCILRVSTGWKPKGILRFSFQMVEQFISWTNRKGI